MGVMVLRMKLWQEDHVAMGTQNYKNLNYCFISIETYLLYYCPFPSSILTIPTWSYILQFFPYFFWVLVVGEKQKKLVVAHPRRTMFRHTLGAIARSTLQTQRRCISSTVQRSSFASLTTPSPSTSSFSASSSTTSTPSFSNSNSFSSLQYVPFLWVVWCAGSGSVIARELRNYNHDHAHQYTSLELLFHSVRA